MSHCAGRLAEAGIEPSAGTGGDFRDNALAERVIGVFKTVRMVILRAGVGKALSQTVGSAAQGVSAGIGAMAVQAALRPNI
ncbi:MAG: hypothetical protein CVT86_03465 [Alphaproteobacteria bacterium HGW-Alphaproteobacteria-8]|nr:MAG: hypothetical protein CVT86_03465 [Alphaproteobacteria bacterium HGW-Alphaproteobacteria-8]